MRASASGEAPFFADQVGNVWTKKAQVDVVGINSMEKTLILGECKWSPQAIGQQVLTDLVQKTDEVISGQGQWQVYYLGFARAGWTEAAKRFAQELSSSRLTGQNWQAMGMRLLDLDQIDKDLHRWATQQP